MKSKLAILASGSGTNAENLIRFFYQSEEVEIKLILSNKPDAYVLERAKKHKIEAQVFSKQDLNNPEIILKVLEKHEIDFIVLAGFLLLIPKHLITHYANKIINIHPSLLPKYGGKGMYGERVHQSVIENGEAESGITIHLVNEKFDDGKILFQAKCEVESSDSPSILAEKIHQLEYTHFPKVVRDYIVDFKSQ